MSNQSPDARSKRSAQRPRSSYSGNTASNINYGEGIAIQCQFCPGQAFRRSRLRAHDMQSLFFMRYPVRCLRCGQRQSVSFTVASVSVPSHIKQRRHRRSTEKFPGWGPDPAEPQASSQSPSPEPDDHTTS